MGLKRTTTLTADACCRKTQRQADFYTHDGKDAIGPVRGNPAEVILIPSTRSVCERRQQMRRRPGKQKGAPGHHLAPTRRPDRVIELLPGFCEKCSGSLVEHAGDEGVEKRQVMDPAAVRAGDDGVPSDQAAESPGRGAAPTASPPSPTPAPSCDRAGRPRPPRRRRSRTPCPCRRSAASAGR